MPNHYLGSMEVQGYLPCRDNFFQEQQSNFCVPHCPSWRQDSASISIVMDVVIFISYLTGLVAAISIIIISIIRRNSM